MCFDGTSQLVNHFRNFAGCCSSGSAAPDSYVPRGTFGSIAKLAVYSTGRANLVDADRVLLLLPDGFGLARHNLILADRFAEHGWPTILPDYFEGDALPVEILKRDPELAIEDHDWPEEQKERLRQVNLSEWLEKHSHGRVEGLLRDMLHAIRAKNPTATIVGVGYCFGGKHVLLLAKWALQAAVTLHPSFVTREDVKGVTAPVYAGLAENDEMIPASFARDLQTWMMQEAAAPFTMEIYPGMKHGFGARPDSADEDVRRQYERAFQRTIGFLNGST